MDDREGLLLRAARGALRERLLDHPPDPELLAHADDPSLGRHAATFVTLRRRADGSLRGCIGELVAYRPLLQSVRANTLAAALRDPRFAPVAPEEVAGLRIEISVLSDPQPVDSPDAIRLGEQGIILRRGEARAVFLPEVATDQGWDLSTTLSALCQKAGLPRSAYRDASTELSVFTSEKIREPG